MKILGQFISIADTLSVIVLLFALLFSIAVLYKKDETLQKILGSLYILIIVFISDHWLTYTIGVIVIATLITEIEFLEKLMAILWNRKEYFEYLKGSKTQQESIEGDTVTKVQKEVITELKKQLEVTTKTKDYYIGAYHFEKTYRLIFDSQLKILNTMFIRENNAISASQANEIYEATRWVENYPFSEYMAFLQNSFLIDYDATSGSYMLTLIGKDFVNYINTNGLPLYKK